MKQPNLASARFQANPHPFWKTLRERAPVYQAKLPGRRRAWLVTRYADAVLVLKDQRFIKDPVAAAGRGGKPPWMPGFLRPLARNMLDLDSADRARLRRLVQRAFTPRRVEALGTRIEAICDELLEKAAEDRSTDLVAAYALPLPVTIIADLLGVPARERTSFHAWSSRVVAVSSPAGMVRGLPAVWKFLRYIRALIALRRQQPGDDLLSALIEAREADDALSEDELAGMVTLLLIAGHETTVNLIASGVLALLEHPAALLQLRADPLLMPGAVEELTRFTSPVAIATERYASEPFELAGARIGQGDQVLVVLSSANRDPDEFLDAEELHLDRAPNRHLAFGQGIHYCVGAPLARLEASIAFAKLLQRFRGLQLAREPQSLQWNSGLFLRGLRALPIAFER